MKESFKISYNAKRALTSKKWAWQYWGAIIDGKWWWVNILIVLASMFDAALLIARAVWGCHPFPYLRIATLVVSVMLLWRTSVVIKVLNTIFCLRKQETRITCSQIVLLVVIGLFIVALVEFLNPRKDSPEAIMLGGAGLVLGWIFQDTIKSVAAFLYLRLNGLLMIEDWIEVPSYGVDGIVKGVSLTTVTLENWDTTTSAIPTFVLQSQHFKNNQKMLEGKTHGRQMLKTFVVDTGWIQYLEGEELSTLRQRIEDHSPLMKGFFDYHLKKLKEDNPAADKVLNIQLYRHYIYHWLMQHEHVSHKPRLIVRWLEQVDEGLPLQVYCFITDSKLDSFEWQQSQIIEHIVESMAWFDLQLYQRTSGYDASNNTITMVEEQPNHKKGQSL